MCSYDLSIFRDDLNHLGIVLNEKQEKQFIMYYELLIDWNEKINLTAITEYQDVLKKHFVDSLSMVKVVPHILDGKVYELIDVGTGAGFPGIPLKIVFPQLKITLLDSLNKRILFLNEVIDILQLTDITAIHGRAEDFAKPDQLREHFDLCVSRAVANLSTLSEYCIPFVKCGGLFISYKSEKAADESSSATNCIKIMGGKILNGEEFMLPGTNIFRTLFVIEKERKTPSKYPRKAGLPSKEPIR